MAINPYTDPSSGQRSTALSDRVALVTGGGGGLGRRTSEALANAGADIAVTYANSRERAEQTCEAVRKIGTGAECFFLDQTDQVSIDKAVDAAADRFGGIDILVNNAGAARDVPFGDLNALTPEIWDELLAINLTGPFLVARAVAPFLRRSGRGRIVNVGSIVGSGPNSSGYAYTVSKAGIVPLTRYLAVALAPDVLVNCVAPGLMEGTQMSSGASEQFIDNWRENTLLKTTTSLDDVAGQIVQFCNSNSVTGQVLLIDGGIHFQ